MTIAVDVRSDAEREAVRLLRLKSAPAPWVPFTGRILFARVRKRMPTPLDFDGALFLVRARTVDGSGRLIEDVLVAVAVRTRRTDVSGIVRCVGAVRVKALSHLANRLSTLASTYQRDWQRSHERQ